MKKQLSLILAVMMAATSVAAVTASAAEPFYGTLLVGDANLDHEITVVDATEIQRFASESATPSQLAKSAADVNGDNQIDVTDATCIQKYAADFSDDCGNAGQVSAIVDPTEPPQQLTPEQVEQQGSAALNEFAVKLLQSSVKQNQNTLVSPLSVMEALGMTANGAAGNTLAEMESVLCAPREVLNQYAKAYPSYATNSGDIRLGIANSLWTNANSFYKTSESFKQTAREYYDAEVRDIPFDEEALGAINGWIDDKTDGMIKNMLNEIEPDAISYLINAIAFDAEWAHPYTPGGDYTVDDYGEPVTVHVNGDVHEGEFTNADGTKSTVDFMHSEESSYLEDGMAQGFMKPYKGGDYAFVAMLPNEGVTLDDYVSSLDGEKLTSLLNGMRYPDTDICARLPKFEVNYNDELNDNLQAMGMKDAFDGNAEFPNMVDGDVSPYLSQVLHRTFINVSENGTRAAAVTIVIPAPGAAPMEEEPKYIYLDRPFLYMIINTRNNTPLFIGTVEKL